MTVTVLAPYRGCDLCGGVDRGPRHVFAGSLRGVHPVNEALEPVLTKNLTTLVQAGEIDMDRAAKILNDYRDTGTTDRHVSCCADAGCPTGTCQKE